MYCNLSKNPAIPLFSTVSRRPRCYNPSPTFKFRSFTDGFRQEALNNRSGSNLSTGSCCQTLESVHHKSVGSGSGRKLSCSSNGSESRSFSCGFHTRTLGSIGGMRTRVFSNGLYQQTLEKSNVLKPRNRLQKTLGSRTVVNMRSFSNGIRLKSLESINGTGIRFFSNDLHQITPENGDRARADRVLPWIAAYKEREAKKVEKRTTVRTNRSSWEESEESYFSRDGRKLLKENRESGLRTVDNLENGGRASAEADKGGKEEEEEEDVEPIEDSRWDRIKSKYKGFVDRETRFEKPEVHRWNKQETWGRKTWKEATESSIPKMVGQGVYGVGPVLAALTVGRREFYVLYVQEGMDLSGNSRKKKDKKGVEKVLKIAEKIGLTVKEAPKHDLNMMVDNRPHQGLVLDASPLEMVSIRELEPVSLEGQRAPLWVALDEVTDPQNLGAIVRSAYFFGVEGLVLCSKNSAPLSGVVSKASAGSLELIEMRSCKNMMQFLSSSTQNGWRVLGGSVSSRAVPLSEVGAGVPTILVLGSEGSGLRPLVERSCTQLIRIPGNMPEDAYAGVTGEEVEEMNQSHVGQELKSFLAVESLNVSVAAGVLLYHLVGNNSSLVGEKQNNALN